MRALRLALFAIAASAARAEGRAIEHPGAAEELRLAQAGATPTPRPSPTPTPGVLAGGGKVTCGWFLPGETASAWYRLPCIYAIDPAVSNSIVRQTGRPLAAREVWAGFLPTDWRMTEAERLAVAQREWPRLGSELAARLARGLPAPELVTMETDTFSWFGQQLVWRHGFFRPNGKLKPIAQWAPVIPPEYRWLLQQWKGAGGGAVTFPPWLFSHVSDIKDVATGPSPGTWLEHATRAEPDLFPAGYPWPAHPTAGKTDYPNSIAFRLNRVAFSRWVRKLKSECAELGVECKVVPQLSNGAYRDLDDDPAAVWQERMAEQLPGILRNNGFPAAVQVELFRERINVASPECAALALASGVAGTEISVFDSRMARATAGRCPP